MNQHSPWSALFRKWLPLGVTIILLGGLMHVAVQQNYRQSANDPQIQIAEDIAAALTSGSASPESIVSPSPTADMTSSLSPFLVLYSATGTPLGGSAALDGKLPTLPDGVLDYAKEHSENRLTWQPKDSFRVAAVITKFTGATEGYVLVGRSLKEVEVREKQLLEMTVVGILVSLLLSFGAVMLVSKKHPVGPEPEVPHPGPSGHDKAI